MNELFELLTKLEKLIPDQLDTVSINQSLFLFKKRCEHDLRVLERILWADMIRILEHETQGWYSGLGKLNGDITETYNDCYFAFQDRANKSS